MKKYIVTLVNNSNVEFKISGPAIKDMNDVSTIRDRAMAYYGAGFPQYASDAIINGDFEIKEVEKF